MKSVLAFLPFSQFFLFFECQRHFSEVGQHILSNKVEVNLDLLCGLRVLNGLNKLGAVVLGVVRNRPEGIGNQRKNRFGADSVLCGAERSNGIFPVLAASVLRNTLAVIGAVDIHLAAAVGAVHQAGQRVRLAPAVRVAFHICPDALHVVKGFLVDDGLMGVFKNRPLALWNIVAFLVLKVLAGLKIDGMAYPLAGNLIINKHIQI